MLSKDKPSICWTNEMAIKLLPDRIRNTYCGRASAVVVPGGVRISDEKRRNEEGSARLRRTVRERPHRQLEARNAAKIDGSATAWAAMHTPSGFCRDTAKGMCHTTLQHVA